ncbi:hypothetical protein L4G45_25580 [Pseudomonas sp. P2498]|nr:hypothetical protein [Pseudomonas petrae]MCF7535562.1 hypothetical protein [Pseudomonas petrae]
MGILHRLFGGRFHQPPPSEPPLSDAAIMRELHPFRAELKAFTQRLLVRMPDKERARLVRRVMRCYGLGEEPAVALTDGLIDQEKGQPLEHLALLAVDWKGHDGFEYLAPHLVTASGIGEPFVYRTDPATTLEEVIGNFDLWLIGHGKRYLHVNTGGDEYVGCIVDGDDVDNMIAMARKAGIKAALKAF